MAAFLEIKCGMHKFKYLWLCIANVFGISK